MKTLYRSRRNRVIAGVFGGMGEVYNIDPNLLRVGFAVLAVLTGIVPFVIVYLIAWAIIPEEASATHHTTQY